MASSLRPEQILIFIFVLSSKNTLRVFHKKLNDQGAFKAFIAKPEDCKDAPAIIVIQEIFGINQDMRDKCIDLAQEGYIAICPDLFWRI